MKKWIGMALLLFIAGCQSELTIAEEFSIQEEVWKISIEENREAVETVNTEIIDSFMTTIRDLPLMEAEGRWVSANNDLHGSSIRARLFREGSDVAFAEFAVAESGEALFLYEQVEPVENGYILEEKNPELYEEVRGFYEAVHVAEVMEIVE
ncbi:hypothetical protein LCM20_09040 [Halobacillus litoralis]|uniref:hypothetical protein n=1 Tax=Halobacillus litoralis TaxID=45668 RepID=UPI001CD34A0A|nr:hypothetical protein [Halobacillus litoralis]MCA0970732.1 hypothetical protein [Halobacillus litoralis]